MASTALVLGGGGVTGVAWELGILAGLAEAGVDLTAADLIVGTSAGAVVAAQITSGMALSDLVARQIDGYAREMSAKMSGTLTRSIGLAVLRTRDPQKFRARIGAIALAAGTVPESDRRTVIESRLPIHDWPARRILITAVDASTGEFVAFDRNSDASLVDAVAASCAVPGVWPPVTIGQRRFIDGGIRSAANADLAAGCDRIVVLAPITRGAGPIPRVSSQVRELSAHARIALVAPDDQARRAIGRNALDPTRRAPSARAGLAQAEQVVAAVRRVWTD